MSISAWKVSLTIHGRKHYLFSRKKNNLFSFNPRVPWEIILHYNVKKKKAYTTMAKFKKEAAQNETKTWSCIVTNILPLN